MKTEGPYQLPNGWVWAKIGEIGILTSGSTPSTRNIEFWNGTIPWITPADLSNYKEKFISKGVRSITTEALNYSSTKLLPPGSILFSSRAPIGYVVIAKNEIATNQGFKNVIPTQSLYSDFVYYYFMTIKQLAESVASGTTFLDLSLAKFSQLPIPFAPINEQKRIVRKIEELFSELDQSTVELKDAEMQLNLYKHLILRNAFDGSLTVKWRNIHKPKSSKQILSLVKSHYAKKYDEELVEFEANLKTWNKSKSGVRPIKPKPKKNYLPVSIDEIESLPILTKSWEWQRIGSIATNVTVGFVGSMKEEYVTKGIPFLRSQNVRVNRFDPKGLKYISTDFHKKINKSKLTPGDVLIVRSGNVGVCCVLPDDIKEANCSDIVIIRKSEFLNSKFVAYYLNSVTNTRIQEKKVGVALTHFNTQSVEEFPIPLLSMDEQLAIVEEIESSFSIIENLENSIDVAIKKIEILKHSILKSAFNGKLVSQDPNDENASLLLTRIMSEVKEYQNIQKEISKSKPRKIISMKNVKTITDILKSGPKTVSTLVLWRKSKHKDDVEEFYNELKKIESKIKVTFKNKESFITLIK